MIAPAQDMSPDGTEPPTWKCRWDEEAPLSWRRSLEDVVVTQWEQRARVSERTVWNGRQQRGPVPGHQRPAVFAQGAGRTGSPSGWQGCPASGLPPWRVPAVCSLRPRAVPLRVSASWSPLQEHSRMKWGTHTRRTACKVTGSGGPGGAARWVTDARRGLRMHSQRLSRPRTVRVRGSGLRSEGTIWET